MIARYLSHPEVLVDPCVPVARWGLGPTGRERVRSWIAAGIFGGTSRVVSSTELKALETAQPIADALGVILEVRAAMHENDRSATGFLPPDEFEATADRFFADPTYSVRGWERAIDAQSRIVAEVAAVLDTHGSGDVLFVGHGGVGTLLYCHHAVLPIDRRHDQPLGGGCVFALSLPDRRVLHRWQRVEAAVAALSGQYGSPA